VSNAREAWSAAGKSGVKMAGPYDYVPPAYWLQDAGKAGGAFGFSTEATGGAGVPPIESLRQMLPAQSLWPIDDVWKFHAGGQEFADIDLFVQAIDARYGKAAGAEDFARKAQALSYEGHRAMFEAFARNKYRATGVIQWMLNNAWPSIIWHLYDWYLRPGGAYFGTKAACRPLHVQYSYDDRSVVVVDDRHRAASGHKVIATVLDADLKTRFSADVTALASLPAPRLAVSARTQAPPAGEGRTAVVRVANTGKTLAFQVRLKMTAGTKELLPVLWEDNYFTLLPGESREVDVSYPGGTGTATVEALAWNGTPVTAAVTR
jgi:exo-1,4-beta-D-glucosaminidase